MTNASLLGKPDAGNPHLRLDKVEVVSAATPRRGSLLCKKWILCGIMLGTASLLAKTEKVGDYTWLYFKTGDSVGIGVRSQVVVR